LKFLDVFVDTNIILDFALARFPFYVKSRNVFGLFQYNQAAGFTSSNCITDAYYILKKNNGDRNARDFLSKLLVMVTVLPIDHAMTLEALQFEFSDFEDAMQYGAALRNRCDCIITRNIGDYKNSKLDVYTPDEFLQMYA
jgi:predicted nucleic acid-binding protein